MNTVRITANDVVVTDQEVEMVEMMANGKPRREIADKLQISHRTVEAKFDTLCDKVHAESMAHLVAIFFRNKLIK